MLQRANCLCSGVAPQVLIRYIAPSVGHTETGVASKKACVTYYPVRFVIADR